LWKHLAGIALAVRLAGSPAHADDLPEAWRTCFSEAGTHYGIAPAVLSAIARTESKLNPSAVHINSDGSSDVGLMQVNSRWFPALRRAGIPPATLYQPCTSIWAGAWILAQAFARHGYTWESIGAYNAGDRISTPSARRRAAYANRVLRNLAHSDLEQQLHDAPRRPGIADFAVLGFDGRGAGGADQ
jgi:soluble lytic murein transglycosylase-like protein